MRVQPYRLWPTSVWQRVERCLAGAMEQWRQDWGIAGDAALEITEAACAAGPGYRTGWRTVLRLGDGRLWLGWDEALTGSLGADWYPSPDGAMASPSSLAAAAGQACLAGLPACLAALLQAETNDAGAVVPPEMVWNAGSGALLVTAALASGTLRYLLDDAAIAALAPAPLAVALAPLPEVALTGLLACLPVALQARVGMTSLSLGELACLQAGDVLVLDVSLDTPLRLTTTGGASICGARPLCDRERVVFALCP